MSPFLGLAVWFSLVAGSLLLECWGTFHLGEIYF